MRALETVITIEANAHCCGVERSRLVESVTGSNAFVRARLACIDDDAQGEIHGSLAVSLPGGVAALDPIAPLPPPAIVAAQTGPRHKPAAPQPNLRAQPGRRRPPARRGPPVPRARGNAKKMVNGGT
jgi:hypothetical protein